MENNKSLLLDLRDVSCLKRFRHFSVVRILYNQFLQNSCSFKSVHCKQLKMSYIYFSTHDSFQLSFSCLGGAYIYNISSNLNIRYCSMIYVDSRQGRKFNATPLPERARYKWSLANQFRSDQVKLVQIHVKSFLFKNREALYCDSLNRVRCM